MDDLIKKANEIDAGKILSQPSEEVNRIGVNSTRKKGETRGRHAKSCNCAKCKARREMKKQIQTPESPEIQTPPVQKTEPQIQTSPIASPNDEVEDLDSYFDNVMNQFNEGGEAKTEGGEIQTLETTEEEPENAAALVTGRLLLTFIDFVAPRLFKQLFSMFAGKHYKLIDIERVKLTEPEKRDLEEVADIVAAKIRYLSPELILIGGLAMIYTANITREGDRIKEQYIKFQKEQQNAEKPKPENDAQK